MISARIADYEIVGTIGRANHGELLLARPPARLQLGERPVVLKVLDVGRSSAIFRRVTRELRAFAAARSKHLVDVYEAGQEGELFYYAREHSANGTLDTPAEPPTRKGMIRAIAVAARAAHALHEVGIAHSDIRPENILLTDQAAKLGELGLAQHIAPGQTVTGIDQQASLEYLDPQILLGGRGGTDVWALGLSLHRSLTGLGVYGDFPMHDPLHAFRTLLTGSPQLSDSLEEAERRTIERCIAPTGRRYAAANELADELEALASTP